MILRTMTLEDYYQVHKLWTGIKGFGIRTIDDSKEGVEKFLKRNPQTSVVAEEDGNIIGSILCGHDGRRGCMYHVCVAEEYRQKGVGQKMALDAMKRLQEEGISKVNLIAFKSNAVGNEFWSKSGWTYRNDINYYDFDLIEVNSVNFVD
ncbi:GNAT family N-acetyltransferase [Lacrimispora celerecrescens]|uniref:Ribosomal protein S18 acetylase RimI-like enzyme n=1 Tax=[Clostridium] celerecrescens 18A TaxID=1286362 RepID=A0A2M8YZW5_9FIRM|nr:GNAT family N-acetyltransferase [Lacrimispora celerecrescens]PJJ26735.1 ribosomal protein S18 acetylase RimI-like enzyme [[Clostridium] celerecrescens 18A]